VDLVNEELNPAALAAAAHYGPSAQNISYKDAANSNYNVYSLDRALFPKRDPNELNDLSNRDILSPTSILNVRYIKKPIVLDSNHNQANQHANPHHSATEINEEQQSPRIHRNNKPEQISNQQQLYVSSDRELYGRLVKQTPQHIVTSSGENRHWSQGGIERRKTENGEESGLSDMDRWLETVFQRALDGSVEDLSDEKVVAQKILGGGDKAPNQVY